MSAPSAGEEQPERDAFEDRPGAVLQAQALQEEDDLEALPVDGGESKRQEAEDHAPAGALEDPPPPAMVVSDPARPIHVVEEPIHHHQQDEYGEQAGGGLYVEAGTAQCTDEPDRHEPGGDRCSDPDQEAGHDRPLPDLVGATKLAITAANDENRLEPLAEDQQGAVDHHGAVAHVLALGGVRNPAPGGEDRIGDERCETEAEPDPEGRAQG